VACSGTALTFILYFVFLYLTVYRGKYNLYYFNTTSDADTATTPTTTTTAVTATEMEVKLKSSPSQKKTCQGHSGCKSLVQLTQNLRMKF
jgi:hypothetical protein